MTQSKLPIQIISDSAMRYLSPRERARIEKQIEDCKKYRRPFKGTIPPYVLLPLVSYLPRNFTIQERSGETWLSEALRSAYGFTVVETTWEGADMLIGSLKSACAKDLEIAYATRKPFAMLLPVSILGDPEVQHLFQRKGIQILLLDRLVEGHALAWFCWALPHLGHLTYGHIPQDEYLPPWMVHPLSRRDIQKGSRSMSA